MATVKQTKWHRIVVAFPGTAIAILFTLSVLAFIAWAVSSTAFMVSAQHAISDTTQLCADRLITEVDFKAALKSENKTLREEVVFLRGKVATFNKLYGLSKESYDASQTKAVGGER